MKTKTNRFFKFITIFVLVAITLVSSFGCGNKNTNQPDPNQAQEIPGKYVVNQAKSQYKIVIPEQASSLEKTAAKELQDFFEEATEIELPIISDLATVAGGKYISVGQTSLVTDSVKSQLNGLKAQGYIVKTEGENIYLLGPSEHGTLYSVYRYLKDAFNFEYYHTDLYSLDKGVGDLPLKDYSFKVNPDIDAMSTPSVGYIQNNSINSQRFTCISSAEWAIPANGTTQVHNLFRITPKELAETHPKWFSTNLATGCFTAQGDANEYQALLDHYMNVAIEGMKISSATTFIVSQPDNCGFCGCSNCIKKSAELGGNGGIMVQFCNDLARKITAWLKSSEGQAYDRDFKLVFLAYQACAGAPTSDIKCDENVGVFIAFDTYRSSYGLHEDKSNENLYQTVMDWKEKTSIFIFWLYDVNFNWYLYPYDTSAYKQDFYKVMKEVGTMVVNDQNQTQNHVATAWGNVKSYISTKLRWDVNADTEALTRDFFKNCYKDSWETMYGVYCQYKAHWLYLKAKAESDKKFDTNNSLKGIFGDLSNKNFWSRQLLEGWIAEFEKALEQIEPLKATDKDAYEKAYKLISAEIISPIYMLLDMYREDYSPADYSALASEFKYYVSKSGVEFHADGMMSTMEELYNSLGI